MISHRNVISNVLQISAFDSVSRQQLGIKTQACLGVLPFSHIYGLLIISYASTFRGDGVIVMPEFDFKAVLAAVQKYKIALLFVVSLHHNSYRITLDLTIKGATHYHSDYPKRGSMCQVRPKLRKICLYRRRTIRI